MNLVPRIHLEKGESVRTDAVETAAAHDRKLRLARLHNAALGHDRQAPATAVKPLSACRCGKAC